MENLNLNVSSSSVSTEQPVITVVMAVYNAAQHLHKSILSVQAQTYKNWRMICVDDGSTDSSLTLLQKYASEDSRITYITKKNGGPASARAKAYEVLTTPYAIILDSDDKYTEDLLEHLLEVVTKEKVDCVAPNLLIEQANGEFMDWNKCYHWAAGDYISGKEAFERCFIGASLHGVNLWNSELLKTYATGENATYNHFNEDEYIQRLLFINSNKVIFSKGSYIYTRNSSSITKGLPLKHLGYLSTSKKYIDLIQEYNIPDEIGNNIKEYYLRHIIALQIRLYQNRQNVTKEHYQIIRTELKKAYNDAMKYRNCYNFKDKKFSWIYKYAATSNYQWFCLTAWIFSLIKS